MKAPRFKGSFSDRIRANSRSSGSTFNWNLSNHDNCQASTTSSALMQTSIALLKQHNAPDPAPVPSAEGVGNAEVAADEPSVSECSTSMRQSSCISNQHGDETLSYVNKCTGLDVEVSQLKCSTANHSFRLQEAMQHAKDVHSSQSMTTSASSEQPIITGFPHKTASYPFGSIALLGYSSRVKGIAQPFATGPPVNVVGEDLMVGEPSSSAQRLGLSGIINKAPKHKKSEERIVTTTSCSVIAVSTNKVRIQMENVNGGKAVLSNGCRVWGDDDGLLTIAYECPDTSESSELNNISEKQQDMSNDSEMTNSEHGSALLAKVAANESTDTTSIDMEDAASVEEANAVMTTDISGSGSAHSEAESVAHYQHGYLTPAVDTFQHRCVFFESGPIPQISSTKHVAPQMESIAMSTPPKLTFSGAKLIPAPSTTPCPKANSFPTQYAALSKAMPASVSIRNVSMHPMNAGNGVHDISMSQVYSNNRKDLLNDEAPITQPPACHISELDDVNEDFLDAELSEEPDGKGERFFMAKTFNADGSRDCSDFTLAEPTEETMNSSCVSKTGPSSSSWGEHQLHGTKRSSSSATSDIPTKSSLLGRNSRDSKFNSGNLARSSVCAYETSTLSSSHEGHRLNDTKRSSSSGTSDIPDKLEKQDGVASYSQSNSSDRLSNTENSTLASSQIVQLKKCNSLHLYKQEPCDLSDATKPPTVADLTESGEFSYDGGTFANDVTSADTSLNPTIDLSRGECSAPSPGPAGMKMRVYQNEEGAPVWELSLQFR